MRFNSIKQKFFFAFLIFVLLTITVSLMALLIYNKSTRLTQFLSDVEQMTFTTLNLVKVEQDFFIYETVNSDLYKTKKSPVLDNHTQIIRDLETQLNALINSKDLLPQNNSHTFRQLTKEIGSYESTFSTLVSLILKRGFKDYGTIGKMRNMAHILENRPEIPIDELLLLRRREKDYIIRKDSQYVNMLNKNSAELRKQLENSGENQETKDSLLYWLDTYTKSFNEVVILDRQIGLNNQTGLFDDLKTHTSRIVELSRQLNHNATQQVEQVRHNNTFFFMVIIAFAIGLGIVLSYLVSYYITRPISQLSLSIRDMVARTFDEREIPSSDHYKGKDEIEMLRQDFHFMINQIKKHIQDIKETAQDLETQNLYLHEINNQLTESENNLKKLNRVKDKFFSIISHDLRSPLHSLVGFLDILKKHANVFSPEEMVTFAGNMDSAVQRILELLENLLNWSLSQTNDIDFKPELVDLNEVFIANIDLYRNNAEKKQINLSYEETELSVFADKNMLDFILRNLISNAVKFTEADGQVTVFAKAESEDFIKITVRDTGVGIKAEYMDKIFKSDEHFSSPGTSAEKGTGFGLMLCQDFVYRNGGTLQVESEEGVGTTIMFTLKSKEDTNSEKPVS